jgi:amidase
MSDTLSAVSLDSSARDLVAALAARQVSALELADAAIARIESRDPPLNAVVVRDFERAREAARAADAALARGERRALLGLPMTVKESHNVAGLPTTWGFADQAGWIAPADSLGVARLKAAGAVILGKTNVPVGLGDWQSVNPIYGRTQNPWDLTRSPGGSSGGGAAALAAGMVPLEFGSDIGGSIRVPAAFCGLFGHKPSFNLIPGRGHAPPGLDGPPIALNVVGPLARTAADLETALDVLAGPAPEEAVAYRLDLPPARGASLADFRVLVIDQHPAAAVEREIRDALETLAGDLARRGAQVVRASASLPDLAQAQEIYRLMLLTMITMRAPGAKPIDAHRWIGLQSAQQEVRNRWAQLFQEVDVVLTPAFGTVAFPHTDAADSERTLTIDGAATPYYDQAAWPGLASLAHLPATAAPIGLSRAGLPVGVQIIGPYLEDRTPLRFAALLEREFGGFKPPPALI